MLPRSCVRGVSAHASPLMLTSPIPLAVCSCTALSGHVLESEPDDTGTLSLNRYRSLSEYDTSAMSVLILNTGDLPPGARAEFSSFPTNHSLDARRRYASVNCHSWAGW